MKNTVHVLPNIKFIFSLLIINFYCLFGFSQSKFSVVEAEILNRRLNKLAIDLKLPGYSIYLGHGDHFQWYGAYGYADMIKSIPASPETCYHCASLTKPFAASILMQLVDSGYISLEDPVLPSILPILKQYGIPIDKSVGDIKVKHLVSHTSDDPPGTYFRYDGDRYSLLSKVIYDARGQSLEQLLVDQIFLPLNMTYTIMGTMIEDYAETNDLLAVPYKHNEDGKIIKGVYTDKFNASTGLVSNVKDLGIFLNELSSRQILSDACLNESMSAFEFKTGGYSNYGLGWYVEDVFGIKTVWHAGYGYCTSGLMMYFPDFNITFAIQSNCDMLSRPFSIGLPMVSVLESPVVTELFKAILKIYVLGDAYPNIAWNKSSKDIIKMISALDYPEYFSIAEMEVKSKWNIARVFKDTIAMEKYYSIYKELFMTDVPPPEGKILVDISNVDSKGSFRDRFNLEKESLIRVVAIADGGYCKYFGMYDKVWIEEAESGQSIWEMEVSYTEFAGGHPRNRIADQVLLLPAGEYIVCFNNRDSPYNHYYGHWEAFPPPFGYWGIKLFDNNNL